MKKVLGIILGVLMCIGAFYCLLMPEITFSTVVIVIGITMIESAIAYFILWNTARKAKKEGIGMLLVNAILSAVAGVILLTNPITQLLMENVILIMIAIYMVAMGIVIISLAIKLKKIEGSKWVLLLILGILVVIAGVMGFINPYVLAVSLGIRMAINIMTTGITLIAASLAYKEDDRPLAINNK